MYIEFSNLFDHKQTNKKKLDKFMPMNYKNNGNGNLLTNYLYKKKPKVKGITKGERGCTETTLKYYKDHYFTHKNIRVHMSI